MMQGREGPPLLVILEQVFKIGKQRFFAEKICGFCKKSVAFSEKIRYTVITWSKMVVKWSKMEWR